MRSLSVAETWVRRAHDRQHGRRPGGCRGLGDRCGADAGARRVQGLHPSTRSYYTLDGKEVDLASAKGGTSTLKQNDRLVAVVKVEATEKGGRILLVDRLPAGLEIENPRLVEGGDTKTLDWLKTETKPEHTEFRDDRFVAAFNFFGKSGRRNRRSDDGDGAGGGPVSKAPSPTSCARSRQGRSCTRRRRSRTCTAPTASRGRRPASSTSSRSDGASSLRRDGERRVPRPSIAIARDRRWRRENGE